MMIYGAFNTVTREKKSLKEEERKRQEDTQISDANFNFTRVFNAYISSDGWTIAQHTKFLYRCREAEKKTRETYCCSASMYKSYEVLVYLYPSYRCY